MKKIFAFVPSLGKNVKTKEVMLCREGNFSQHCFIISNKVGKIEEDEKVYFPNIPGDKADGDAYPFSHNQDFVLEGYYVFYNK